MERTTTVGVVLIVVGVVASFVMFPAIASEPKPRDYKEPAWVIVCWVVMASAFVLGAVFLGVASRWRQQRRRLLAALEVQVFRGELHDPRNSWVRLIDPRTGASSESTTEASVSANTQRALDLLMEQPGAEMSGA